MTVTQPSSPYGPAAGPLPGGSPTPPAGPPGYDWRYPPPARRGNKLVTAGIVITALIALAALAVALAALVTRSTPAPGAARSSAAASSSSTPTGDTSEADRALCTAIAPLMAENDHFSNVYIRLGEAGSRARDQALPKFISDTQNWTGRVQPILDQHPDVNQYLRRTLQRFLDDRNLLVSDMQAGPLTSYANALWADSLGAYSGPLHVCAGVGVRW